MKRLLILYSVCWLVGLSATAQHVILNPLNEGLYKARVKLIDEFMARFNGEETRPDISVKRDDAQRMNLTFLFNGELFKGRTDPKFIEAQQFIDTVLATGMQLHFADTTWAARVVCAGKLKGKPATFTLWLTVEDRGDDMYKWVIAKAEGDKWLTLEPPILSDQLMLLPNAHEMNFMSLPDITKDNPTLAPNYARRSWQADPTTAFFTLVYNGLLTIDHVKELEFVFLQVPGWTFSVREFEREQLNAGWLISHFERTTDNDKQQLLQSLHP